MESYIQTIFTFNQNEVHEISYLICLKMQEKKIEGFRSWHGNPEDENKAQQSENPQKRQLASLSHYEQVIGKVCLKGQEEIRQKVMASAISYPEYYSSQLSKIILRKDKSSYIFKVSIGRFYFDVFLLKLNFDSYLLQRKVKHKGTYADIYACERDGETFAFKSQKVRKGDFQDISKKLDLILKEYAASKIASLFQFGPKLSNFYGYDILCFNDSIEFSMELCELPHQVSKKNAQNIEKDLKRNLKTMHSLQIVHCDIKNSNVAWSPSFKKWVFIDFGFVKFLKEKIGQRTITRFLGTYTFTSQEMKSLFHLKSFGVIDMYSNDLFGLQLVLKTDIRILFDNHSFYQNNEQSNKDEFFNLFANLIMFKHKLFNNDYSKLEQVTRNQIRLRKQILSLLLQQIQKNKISKNYKSNKKLRSIFKKYSQRSKQEEKSVQNFNQNFCYILKNFSGSQQSWDQIDFFSGHENELESYIQQFWGDLYFSKELLIFIDSAIFSSDKLVIEKLKGIVITIAKKLKLFVNERSWFWSLRNVLIKVQQIFLEQKFYHPLHQLRIYYQIFNDRESINRIEENFKLYPSIISCFGKKINVAIRFIETATNNSSLNELTTLFEYYSQIELENYEKQKLSFFKAVTKILTFILNATLKKQIQKCDSYKMEELIRQTNRKQLFSFYEPGFFIIYKFKLWCRQFSAATFAKKNNFNLKQLIDLELNESPCKYISFWKSLQDLRQGFYEIENLHSISQKYRLYPILEEIPQLSNFQYQFRKRNIKKANQIAQDIINMWNKSLQAISEALFSMKKREETEEKQTKYIISILKEFLLSYDKKIQRRKLSQYWRIFFNCLSFLCDKRGHLQKLLKEQVIKSIHFIINYFSPQSVQSKYFVILFECLLKFIEGKFEEALSFLFQIYKGTDFKTEPAIEQEYILCLSFYFRQTSDTALKQNFFAYIEQKQNSVRIFYTLPEVFRQYIQSLNSQQIAYSALKKTTYYLYCLSHSGYLIDLIFKQHFLSSNYGDLENLGLKIAKFEKLKTIRENNHMSAFIGSLFLKLNQPVSLKLSKESFKRLLILSLISINKFAYKDRITIRDRLVREIRLQNKNKSLRKKNLILRHSTYKKITTLEEKIKDIAARKQQIFVKLQKKINDIQKNQK